MTPVRPGGRARPAPARPALLEEKDGADPVPEGARKEREKKKGKKGRQRPLSQGIKGYFPKNQGFKYQYRACLETCGQEALQGTGEQRLQLQSPCTRWGSV